MLRACYVTGRSWEPGSPEIATLPLALGSLGVQTCLRCRSLLRALVSRIVYVTVRSWEPWCCERVTSPFAVGGLGVKSFLRYRSLFYLALGSLGVESLLRHRSLLEALVFKDCDVAARSWEPWC